MKHGLHTHVTQMSYATESCVDDELLMSITPSYDHPYGRRL